MRSFEWADATSVADAVQLLEPADRHADPDTQPRPMGGGQDLLTTMKDGIVRPPRVVNLKTIGGLGGIKLDANQLTIGALATITQLHESALIQQHFPGLAEAAFSVASPQIRNIGTVGGNLCQRPRCWYFRLENVICIKKGGSTCYAKDGQNKYNAIFGGGPSYIVHPSDLAPMLVAMDAKVSTQGPKGVWRTVPLGEFFTLPRDASVRKENVLFDGEIITAIHVPATAMARRSTYLKFKERESLDFAMASVAAALELNADKTVKQARIVLGGVAPIPWRVQKAEAALVGQKCDDATLKHIAELALAGAEPLEHNGYKIPLTKTLVRRAITHAANLPERT